VRGFENGQAFEAAITVRLRNIASGEILDRVNTQVARADVAQAGPFTATLTFTPPGQNTAARIEVVTFSPRDGSETMLASRDVVVGPSAPAGRTGQAHAGAAPELSPKRNRAFERDVLFSTSLELFIRFFAPLLWLHQGWPRKLVLFRWRG
jgi:hypothetical protein